MADEFKFQSITDLYNHLLPAIKTKLDDLKKIKILDVSESDIWEYCLKNIWSHKTDLNIYEIVNDILFLDVIKLNNYLKGRTAK